MGLKEQNGRDHISSHKQSIIIMEQKGFWDVEQCLQYAEKYVAPILKRSATTLVITPPHDKNGFADQKRELNSLIAEAKRESAK